MSTPRGSAPARVTGLTLDTGALIAVESANPRIRALLAHAQRAGLPIHVPATVVAQAWRGGFRRQALIALLLNARELDVIPLDEDTARLIGVLCGRSGHADIVDVNVVQHARLHGHTVVTSDPDDLRRVDPALPIVTV